MNRLGTLLLIGLLLVAGGPLFAQQTGESLRDRAGMGYFIGGIGWLLESDRSSIAYSTGGGGHGIRNGWILGGEGHSSFGPGGAGGYGFFNLGYALVSTGSLLVYPLLGLGGGAVTRDASPSVSRCALLNPSVGMDYLIPVRERAGVLVGLRAGYTFDVYSDTFHWSMPHLRLVVGGFGVEK